MNISKRAESIERDDEFNQEFEEFFATLAMLDENILPMIKESPDNEILKEMHQIMVDVYKRVPEIKAASTSEDKARLYEEYLVKPAENLFKLVDQLDKDAQARLAVLLWLLEAAIPESQEDINEEMRQDFEADIGPDVYAEEMNVTPEDKKIPYETWREKMSKGSGGIMRNRQISKHAKIIKESDLNLLAAFDNLMYRVSQFNEQYGKIISYGEYPTNRDFFDTMLSDAQEIKDRCDELVSVIYEEHNMFGHKSEAAKKLVMLANQLDEKGFVKEANEVDEIMIGSEPKEYTFDSTWKAYSAAQSDDMKDGDILIIPSEGVVGIANSAWPMAITKEHGQLHCLGDDYAWEDVEGGKFLKSVERAKEIARGMGAEVRD